MNKEEYRIIANLMNKIPPKNETPEGQKFHIGEIVKISTPKSWFAKEKIGKLFQIEYSYSQKYGGSDYRSKNEYSLKHLFEDNSSAWYNVHELELVKGIDTITEEKDLSEYKRLKEKYDKLPSKTE